MNTTGPAFADLAAKAAPTAERDQADQTAASFLRYLGLAERLFYLYGERSNVNFSLAAVIEGSLTAEALLTAFREVIDRHPLLSIRVAPGRTGQLAFFEDGPTPQINIYQLARAGWPSFATRDVAQSLGKVGAAFFNATVLLEANAATLILTFHHTVANGGSAVTVLTDLLSALAGRTLISTPLPASLEGYAGYEDALSNYDRKIEQPATPGMAGFETATDGLQIATLSIGRDDTAALLEASRANGTTLHGLLGAALAAVRACQGSEGETRLLSAVDLRDAVGAPSDACAFLNGVVLTPVPEDQPFWETARSISAAAAAYREPAAVRAALQHLAEALPAEASADAAVAILEGPFGSDVEVTNLGALKISSSYGDLKITDVWGPIPSPKTDGAPIVGIIGLHNELRITETHRADTKALLPDLHAFLASPALVRDNTGRSPAAAG